DLAHAFSLHLDTSLPRHHSLTRRAENFQGRELGCQAKKGVPDIVSSPRGIRKVECPSLFGHTRSHDLFVTPLRPSRRLDAHGSGPDRRLALRSPLAESTRPRAFRRGHSKYRGLL